VNAYGLSATDMLLMPSSGVLNFCMYVLALVPWSFSEHQESFESDLLLQHVCSVLSMQAPDPHMSKKGDVLVLQLKVCKYRTMPHQCSKFQEWFCIVAAELGMLQG